SVNTESKIFAIKHFILNKNKILSENLNLELYENDSNFLSDYDYYQKEYPNLNLNWDNYEIIIDKILYNNKYRAEEFNLEVKFGDNKSNYKLLRLLPENSIDYQNYVIKENLPILMAGGLWSDINAWEKLGRKLANQGHEVYLLELTGGILSECDNCHNYNYDELIGEVYPQYINKVLELSGKNKIKYVGHSNGARTALDAISKNYLNEGVIETLVLVGIPGAFEELSFFAKIINKSGDIALERFNKKNISHITIGNLAHELESISGELIYPFMQLHNDKNKISSNLFKEYYMWINSNSDKQPGTNVNINYLSLIYGDVIGFERNDLIVSVVDEVKIFNNINASFKKIIETDSMHLGMTNKNEIKELVENSINKKLFN
ncbi:MAG: hypothetical protein KC589_08195, partial [Nanoarchaeota archaeon]|nr:hypothetical protein [Nanoarchaeota archaeon]